MITHSEITTQSKPEILQEVRAFYHQHMTHESKILRKILQDYQARVLSEGVVLLLAGSVSFGQAVQESDIDGAYSGPMLFDFEKLFKEIKFAASLSSVHVKEFEFIYLSTPCIQKDVQRRRINPFSFFYTFVGTYWSYEKLNRTLDPLFDECQMLAKELEPE